MKYLLDTHVILWMFDDNSNLSEKARSEIENIENECFVSIISLYEIAIKKNIGKLETIHSIKTLANEIENVGLKLLPVDISYLEKYMYLPQFDNHKDPFDRLIISTALIESLKIISVDGKFKLYEDLVSVLW